MSWRTVRIRHLVDELDERAGPDAALPVLTVTKHDGIVLSSEYFKSAVHSRDTAGYKVVRRGDFAYSTIHLDEGSIGRQCIVDAGLVSPMYTVFRPRDCVDAEFLIALLKSDRQVRRYGAFGQGSVNRRASIGFEAFGAMKVELPDLREQRAIARVLGGGDELVYKCQSALNSVQYQKSQERDAAMRHLSKTVPLVACDELLSATTVGIVVKPASLYTNEPTGVLALRSMNVREDRIDLTDCVRIRPAAHREHSKSALNPGDVPVVRTGTPGIAACVPEGFPPANCIDVIICRPGPRIRGEYLAYYLNSSVAKAQFRVGQGGLAQQHFNVGMMKKLLVPIPSLDRQQEIIKLFQAFDHRLTTETAHLTALRTFRRHLADALLSGRLRIPAHLWPAPATAPADGAANAA